MDDFYDLVHHQVMACLKKWDAEPDEVVADRILSGVRQELRTHFDDLLVRPKGRAELLDGGEYMEKLLTPSHLL